MVRLKDNSTRGGKKSSRISIPYGAIKSNSAMKTILRYSKISIPYGAIKRVM